MAEKGPKKRDSRRGTRDADAGDRPSTPTPGGDPPGTPRTCDNPRHAEPATPPMTPTPRPRRERLSEADLSRSISVQQHNPKQAGSKSHARYELYRRATTVREFLSLGGSRADLNHDVGKHYVTYVDS